MADAFYDCFMSHRQDSRYTWRDDNIKVALLTSAYPATSGLATHTYFVDIEPYEVVDAGYSGGGEILSIAPPAVTDPPTTLLPGSMNFSVWKEGYFLGSPVSPYSSAVLTRSASHTTPIISSIDGTRDSYNPIGNGTSGSVDDNWLIAFTSDIAFDITRDVPNANDVAHSGTTQSITAPINSDTNTEYFTIPVAFWGGTWVAGDTVEFTTTSALLPVWTGATFSTRYAAIYSVGGVFGDPLIALLDFETLITVTDTFTLPMNVNTSILESNAAYSPYGTQELIHSANSGITTGAATQVVLDLLSSDYIFDSAHLYADTQAYSLLGKALNITSTVEVGRTRIHPAVTSITFNNVTGTARYVAIYTVSDRLTAVFDLGEDILLSSGDFILTLTDPIFDVTAGVA